jgi:hypothetical protein
VVIHLSLHYVSLLCKGSCRAAQEAGTGTSLSLGTTADDCRADPDCVPLPQSPQAICKFAARCRPDARIISLDSISACYNVPSILRFLEKFRGISVIVPEVRLPGYRCITIANISGFEKVPEHLIVGHGDWQIGYVDGKANNYDAKERRRTFLSGRSGD